MLLRVRCAVDAPQKRRSEACLRGDVHGCYCCYGHCSHSESHACYCSDSESVCSLPHCVVVRGTRFDCSRVRVVLLLYVRGTRFDHLARTYPMVLFLVWTSRQERAVAVWLRRRAAGMGVSSLCVCIYVYVYVYVHVYVLYG